MLVTLVKGLALFVGIQNISTHSRVGKSIRTHFSEAFSCLRAGPCQEGWETGSLETDLPPLLQGLRGEH